MNSPVRIILLFFLGSIITGVFLLSLPFATTSHLSLLDKIFTATSAVTVTGLIVADTGKDFTLFGKLVILLLIQVGGLGYMTYSTFFLLTFKKLGHKERLALVETLNYPSVSGILRFFKKVLVYAFVIESIGALGLFAFFLKKGVPAKTAFFIGLFHAVSAFNNAGFSTFSTSLTKFAGSVFINLWMAGLIILGGLGFYVLQDLEHHFFKKTPLKVHTKMVLLITAILLITGFAWFFFIECNHNEYLNNLPLKDKFLISLFTSVTSRTAGFNTIDLSKLSEPSLFFLSLLMFVGGSPGGTAGGVKTTNVMIVLLTIWSYIQGKKEVLFCRRKIGEETIKKALVVLTLAFFVETIITLLISLIDHTPLLYTMFETISAFSTVGLSVGNGGTLSYCANFTPLGKILIILSMFIGRVGFLTFLTALAGKTKESHIKHIEAKILT